MKHIILTSLALTISTSLIAEEKTTILLETKIVCTDTKKEILKPEQVSNHLKEGAIAGKAFSLPNVSGNCYVLTKKEKGAAADKITTAAQEIYFKLNPAFGVEVPK